MYERLTSTPMTPAQAISRRMDADRVTARGRGPTSACTFAVVSVGRGVRDRLQRGAPLLEFPDVRVTAFAVVAAVFAALPFVAQPAPQAAGGLLDRIDHLVYATPDLTVGIDTAERQFGVRASPGGRHPGEG